MPEVYWVYITASKRNGTLYVGMTNNLKRRIWQHKHKTFSGFTSKYNVSQLVFFERFGHPMQAIEIEKRIKGWTRIKKLSLIESMNPKWKDLSELDPSFHSG